MPRIAVEFTQAKARAPGADFADYCCELLGSLGVVKAKRMFLGWGLSVDEMTVAIIAWDTLYLKTNADTASHFVSMGCKIFEHEAKGRVRRMHFYSAPENAMESRAAMQPWAALAKHAAIAALKPPKAPKLRETRQLASLGKSVKSESDNMN
jgi:DNA transformation protein and related proteins